MGARAGEGQKEPRGQTTGATVPFDAQNVPGGQVAQAEAPAAA